MSQQRSSESLNRRDTIDSGRDEYKISPENKTQILPPPGHPKEKLYTRIPILYWLPRYDVKANLSGDIIAGLTAGIMLIPQGMAYALIAGLDPIYGLYSALFGPLVYAFFGTSGQLSVAPVAIVSLLTAEGVESQISDEEDTKEYVALASLLAFQVGIVQAALGAANAGVIANMLSHSVIVGFTGAAALLIGMSQVKYVLKISIKKGEFFEMLIDLFKNIKDAHWQTILLSIVCIAILWFLKTWKKKPNWYGAKYAKFIPGALIVVVLSTIFSAAIGDSSLFAIVGKQEAGLPSPSNFFGNIHSMNQFWSLWVDSILISVIGFLESYAVANKYAEMKNYHIDASQELFALGVTNIVSCWFQCYPTTGGLSRTAVAEAAGANTPINSGISAAFMVFALAVLITLFEWLPAACLGSIVIVAVTNLFDYKAMIHLWHIKKRDFWVMFTTLSVTLVLGIETGVACGVIASLLLFVQRASKPHYAILGKLPNEQNVWRNVKNYLSATERHDMLVFRWDASLFFANVDVLKKRVLKHIGRFLEKNKYPKHWCLVLNFGGVNDIDASAAEALHPFFEELHKKFEGFQLLMTNLKKPVRNVLEIAEVIEVVGEDKIFYEMGDAEKYWNNYIKNMDSNDNGDGHDAVIGANTGIESSQQDDKALLHDDSVDTKNKQNNNTSDPHETIETDNNNDNNNDDQANDENNVKVDINDENDDKYKE